MANFNYKPHSDFAVKQYNDISKGMALKFWNSTQGYVIYDKLGKVVANGYTKMEQGLIKEIQEKRLKRNIIKFELSLERKQSLEAVLRRFISTKRHALLYYLVNMTTKIGVGQCGSRWRKE